MKTTKLKIAIVFFFFIQICLTQGQITKSTDRSQILSDLYKQNKVAGVSAGYLVNGNSQWTDAAGFANVEKKVRFTAQTKTRTASIGKAMTAIAIMQLKEKGKLNIDDPVKKYLDFFPDHEAGVITIRHLLNHTSGIGAYQNNEFNSLTEYKTLKDAMLVFQNRSLRNKPGEGYYYTSYGYVVLGAIVEAISVQSFEKYLQKNIWNPTGMKNTGVEHFSKKYKNKAKLYELNGSGLVEPKQQNNLSNRVPGGGFYSTVEDLLLFGKAVLSHDLVTKESFDEMIKDPGIKQGGSGYGFGWYLYGKNRKGENVIGHSGTQAGAATQLFIWPEVNRVVVAMSNTSGAYDDIFNCADEVGGKSIEAMKRLDLIDKMTMEEMVFTSSSGQAVQADVGSLKVPENRNNPKSIDIPIHFIRLKSTNPNPGSPIIYLEGGPGVSCTWQAGNPNYLQGWLPYLEVSDVILLDQRGTGAGRSRVSYTSQKDPAEDVLLNEGNTRKRRQEVSRDALAELTIRGVDLDGYTTIENATDINILRQALGYEKWNLFGFSYGTHLGQAYLKYFEAYVDNAVLVGVEGLDQTFKLPMSMDIQFHKIAQMAAADPKVNRTIPDLVELYKAVAEKLEETPAEITINSPITGQALKLKIGSYGLNYILRFDMGDASDIPVFPRLLTSIYQEDYSMLEWFVQKRIGNLYGLNGMSTTMDLASGASPDRLQRIGSESEKSLFGSIVNLSKMGTAWPAPDLGASFRAPLSTHVRTLFMSGTLDFNTPPYQAEQLRWGFSNSHHIIVNNAGHEQILRHPESSPTIVRFLQGKNVDDVALAYPKLEFIPAIGNAGDLFHPSMTKSVAYSLSEKMSGGTIAAGVEWFEEFKNADGYSLVESEMNTVGYSFLQAGKIKKAIAVFQLNVDAFPESWNVYDSLGEAYLADGNNKQAVINYKKSLELNPENEYGKEALKKLGEVD